MIKMNDQHAFAEIVNKVRQVYKNARPGIDCPSIEALDDYTAGELAADEKKQVAGHISGCSACRMVAMRFETEHYIWNQAVAHDPEVALLQALGKKGNRIVSKLVHKNRASRSGFISNIKENLVTWASPMWQPLYAGEAVTAADVEEQAKTFEMDYGEYINLSCHWHDEKEGQPCIDLSWQANLLEPSRLWARFINPDTSSILSEILLGSELAGRKSIKMDELDFNPTTDKWAIAIIVEETK